MAGNGEGLEVVATMRTKDALRIAVIVAGLLASGVTGMRWVSPQVTEYVTRIQAVDIAREATIAALKDQQVAMELVVRAAMRESLEQHDRAGHERLSAGQYEQLGVHIHGLREETRERLRELRDDMLGRNRQTVPQSGVVKGGG